MFKEKDMQNILEQNPATFLGPDKVLYGREFWLGTSGRIDFIFFDTMTREHLLVELQHRELNEEHAERLYNQYLPYYRDMRPGIRIKGILIANSVSPRLKELNEKRGVEVLTFSESDFLNAQQGYVHEDISRSRKLYQGDFHGFAMEDFEDVIEAERQYDGGIRRKAIGKMHQLRDYLIDELRPVFPDIRFNPKVSDRKTIKSLDVPWMGFFFSGDDVRKRGIPNINFTLAEGSEMGTFRMSDCSVHLNAELKPTFTAVMKLFHDVERVAPLVEQVRNRGFQVRMYSKIPVKPTNTNSNIWNLRGQWDIDDAFNPQVITDWYQGFEENNADMTAEDVERAERIYSGDFTKFVKKNFMFTGNKDAKKTLTAAARGVCRIGRFWSPEDAVRDGAGFRNSVAETIEMLESWFKELV